MKIDKYLYRGLMLVSCMTLPAFFSCSDEINLPSKVDEATFESVNRVDGMLLDKVSNRNESVVELFSATQQMQLYFKLSQTPRKGVDVVVSADADYLTEYNKIHNTDFKLFPVSNVSFGRNGVLLLAPDETESISVDVTLTKSDDLTVGETYVLPVKAVSTTEGITLSSKAQHAVLLIKPLAKQSDTFKGEGALKTVLYLEVNDVNPLNALEFVLQNSGKLFFDEVVLFSANINYKAETGRVYVFNNPNVQFLLDHNEEYLQPLRKRGIKVILSILGNHDQAGVAQLSDTGARMFASELATYCKAYNLDGVGFDDEYSGWPDLNNPLFTSPSASAAGRLFYETKKANPDKTVMYYQYSLLGDWMPDIEGVRPNEYVDYIVPDYGASANPLPGMTLKNCAGEAASVASSGAPSVFQDEVRARRAKALGYGYYMIFSLDPNNYASRNQVIRCQNICRGLYNDELVAPTHYYKKNDTTRYKI